MLRLLKLLFQRNKPVVHYGVSLQEVERLIQNSLSLKLQEIPYHKKTASTKLWK